MILLVGYDMKKTIEDFNRERDEAIISLIDGELCDVLEHYATLLLDCKSKLGMRRAKEYLESAVESCESAHVALLEPFIQRMIDVVGKELDV